MSGKTRFESVWDALEDDPVRQENIKLRSELIITISETIRERGLKQQDAAELLHISQPRASALLQGKIEEYPPGYSCRSRASVGTACIY